MATAPNVVTPEEYLRLERTAEIKHEYVHGQIFAMAGANKKHRAITDNVLFHFRGQRTQTGCIPDNSDTRIYIPATGGYTYADVVLTCGDQQRYQDDVLDTLLNPTLIVEVLSPSTEACDRAKKFQHYQSIPAFCEYLLLSQDEMLVEYFVRQAARDWRVLTYRDAKETMTLLSGIVLPISVLYEGIDDLA